MQTFLHGYPYLFCAATTHPTVNMTRSPINNTWDFIMTVYT